MMKLEPKIINIDGFQITIYPKTLNNHTFVPSQTIEIKYDYQFGRIDKEDNTYDALFDLIKKTFTIE